MLQQLEAGPMTLTQLSRAMGYKGITKKLSETVSSLVQSEKIRRTVENNEIRYSL